MTERVPDTWIVSAWLGCNTLAKQFLVKITESDLLKSASAPEAAIQKIKNLHENEEDERFYPKDVEFDAEPVVFERDGIIVL